MRTLEQISVAGFKSIRELKNFKLRQLNVLIGENGAGKSNLLKLFELLHQTLTGQLSNYTLHLGGADTVLHLGQKKTAICNVCLGFRANDLASNHELRFEPTTNGSLFVSSVSTPVSYEGYLTSFLVNSRPYHFDDTSESARVKQIGDIGDNEVLRPDARNLAAFLYLLRNHFSANYQLIVETIRQIAPFFDDFVLRPLPENPNKIRLEWRDKGSDDYFDASYLSDGTLRFICLATLLLQPKMPSLLIVDEPELGLHPSALNLLAEMLASAATKTQVLVSTQSVSLVNEFQPEDIIVVDREGHNSTFKRLNADDLADWLAEYSVGELWEKNVIGGRP